MSVSQRLSFVCLRACVSVCLCLFVMVACVSAIAIPLTLTESILPCVGDYNLSPPPPHTGPCDSRGRTPSPGGRVGYQWNRRFVVREGQREGGGREKGPAGRRQEGGREGYI